MKLNNQKGQLVVEAILLMVVLASISLFASRYLKENQIARKLSAEPWAKLSGMIECGTWNPCRGSKGMHPQTNDRIISYRTEDVVK
jgi:hypothetical protein